MFLTKLGNKIITLFAFFCCSIASYADQQFTYLFCHGRGQSHLTANHYLASGLIPDKNALHRFNFSDIKDNVFHPKQCALGQRKDIETLKEVVHHVKKKSSIEHNQEANIILFGVSRGAATIINYAGKEKPTNIKAIIVESPFAHIDDALTSMYGFLSLELKRKIFNYFHSVFDFNAEHPIDFVSQINPSIPVAFICSKADAIVPYESTMRLYKALKNAGHENIHLLVLESGEHARITYNAIYKQFTHAFYRKYNLPHNKTLADYGEKYLHN